MLTWETDTQFERKQLVEVSERSDSGWSVTFDDGWIFSVPADSPIEPQKGDMVRLYGKGIGSTVRGLVIEGNVVFYRTPEQDEQRQQEWWEQRQRGRRQRFEESRAELDAQFEALPEPFRNRIERFRLANPNFRWEYEAYEMFTCSQAVVIAKALRTVDAIDTFREQPWETQQFNVPDLSDGHSGNTFGCACYLAKVFLTCPENVAIMPGAMSPLVGTADYSTRKG